MAAALLTSLVSTSTAHALDPAKAISQYVHRAWLAESGPSNGINDVAQTPDGYLWLANEAGLVRFDGVRFTTYDRRNLPQLVNDRIVSALVDRSGALWLGTTRGLVRLACGCASPATCTTTSARRSPSSPS
jgi:ligand-binding sensor domain-containing protein